MRRVSYHLMGPQCHHEAGLYGCLEPSPSATLWFPAAERACVQFGRSYRAVRLFGFWEFLYSLLSSAHPFWFIARCIKDLSSVA